MGASWIAVGSAFAPVRHDWLGAWWIILGASLIVIAPALKLSDRNPR